MSQKEKLLRDILNNPKNVRFESLDKVLRNAGFECRQSRKGSSHYVYTRGEQQLTVVKHKPVNAAYVKQAIAFLEGDDN